MDAAYKEIISSASINVSELQPSPTFSKEDGSSDCSFSCGNAFPCLAQKLGYAKIIGEKSGGGECAVGIHYLPNGEYVYHSSNLHLGYYDEASNVFTGFEDGAKPDVSIGDYYSFFDVNVISNLIQNN